MSIRIREVGGVLVALCAARTDKEEGDIYLDDGVHHALGMKFWRDWSEEEGRMEVGSGPEDEAWPIMERLERKKRAEYEDALRNE